MYNLVKKNFFFFEKIDFNTEYWNALLLSSTKKQDKKIHVNKAYQNKNLKHHAWNSIPFT